MNKNKQVLKHCPNFYKIMDFEYYEDDVLSEKIINVYHDFVFKVDINNKKSITKLEQIDFIINKYIDDYFFRKELKAEMSRIRIRKGQDILIGLSKYLIIMKLVILEIYIFQGGYNGWRFLYRG